MPPPPPRRFLTKAASSTTLHFWNVRTRMLFFRLETDSTPWTTHGAEREPPRAAWREEQAGILPVIYNTTVMPTTLREDDAGKEDSRS
ncbi:hypothetical protein Ae201684P_017990 [Aphanomyces euteiches]|uniref:Uncharacterized protein n=1 Tax=Aphanomyces euteiches TaxID=100861 RepID=A0A6G0XLI5_9STRA|nr:hypothetical protein Ae201684_003527 [Aphanomyces euteiches]KAH9098780.1 hypothetical protein Ae201684P_017990 [Aphanomyces euteiches]